MMLGFQMGSSSLTEKMKINQWINGALKSKKEKLPFSLWAFSG